MFPQEIRVKLCEGIVPVYIEAKAEIQQYVKTRMIPVGVTKIFIEYDELLLESRPP